MNKGLLIKHINGEASEKERTEIIAWINKDKRNESYYTNLMNLLISQKITGESYELFSRKQIHQRLQSIEKRVFTVSENDSDYHENRVDKSRFKWIVYAAGILLLVSLCLNLYQYKPSLIAEKPVILPVSPKTEVLKTLYTDRGVKGKLILPDSSVVWLNSDSKIEYPERFSADVRRVRFYGEGFFEVTKNPKWPMVVTTQKGMNIEVLGTKFHIRSYNNDDTEQTTLFSGKIHVTKIIDRDGRKELRESVDMIPNETIVFGEAKSAAISHLKNISKKVAWKNGELLFEQTPMEDVVKMLERWHGANIVIVNQEVLSHRFTASFNSESLVQILELLKFTTPIDYRIVDNKVYLMERKI